MNAAPGHIMPDFCSRRHPFHIATAVITLMKLGVDLRHLRLFAVGHYENYRGEVHAQSPEAGAPLTPDTQIVLHIGADSAVDIMPYQFFYGVSGGANRSDAWEDDARRLLAPFDSAVERYEGLAGYLAMQYRMGLIEPTHLTRFFELFGFSSKESAASLNDRLMWAALLPTFHFWAGNPVFVERAISFFLCYPCHITENVPARFHIPEDLQYRLGADNDRLGMETTLGRSFEETDSCYLVTLSDVSPDDVPKFLPGQPLRKRLEAILATCMPGHLEFKIQVLAQKTGFYLGRSRTSSHLGYTSHV